MRTDTVTALADAEPRVFWLDTPARPPPRPALQARPAPTSSSSAAATPGCGPRCWPRSATPAATSSLLEGDRIGWAAQRAQRRLLRGEPDPRRGQRPRARSRTSTTTLERLGRDEPRRDRGDRRALRHRLRLRRTGELTVATEPHQVPGCELAADGAGELPRPATRSAPRSTRRPTSPGSGTATGPALVDPAALAWGLAAAAEAAGRADRRAHARSRRWRAAGAGARRCGPRRRDRAGRPGGAGHQRVPVAAAAAAAAHRAGLRLRADDRAADRRAARRRSAGATGRASATRPTSSTTTG